MENTSMTKSILTTQDIIEYAIECGSRAAADLMLLAGYDGTELSVVGYNSLLAFLEAFPDTKRVEEA